MRSTTGWLLTGLVVAGMLAAPDALARRRDKRDRDRAPRVVKLQDDAIGPMGAILSEEKPLMKYQPAHVRQDVKQVSQFDKNW